MGKIDWRIERERLAAVYKGMSDGELREVANDADSLTDEARKALRAEMLGRGMEAPPETRMVAANKDHKAGPPPVIVGRYRDLPTATVAKSILDWAGIESILADDNFVRLDWLMSNALGGIKLLVRDDDAQEAEKLLEEQVPEKFGVEGVGEYEQPKCPTCGSYEVSLDGLDRKVAYPGLLLGIPIPAVRSGWNCHDCGHSW